MARSHKILTLDKLKRCKHITVNGCPMCQDEESVHHLLIHCVLSRKVWSAILKVFDMQWVMPLKVAYLFHQWRLRIKYVRMRILWKVVLYAVCWKIWLARNNHVFKNKSNLVEDVVASIIWSASEWVLSRIEFKGVCLEDLSRSWAAHFQGGWVSKSLNSVSCECPTTSFLKLSFDGSYVQAIGRGGIGGVIRDWNGITIRNFSGLVDSLDANESEMKALLVGCSDLRKLESSKVIIEGDSFSTIQWSLGNCSYPWTLADMVEEVQDIVSQLDAALHHVLREANVSTDNPAKEGVLRSSLSFDV